MTASVGNLNVSLGLDAAEFTQGLTKAEAQAQKFAANQKRIAGEIDKTVQALERQAKAAAMTANQARLSALAQRGATAEQLKAAEAALSATSRAQQSKEIDKTISALQQQNRELRDGAESAALYALAQQGATKSQLAAAQAALTVSSNLERSNRIEKQISSLKLQAVTYGLTAREAKLFELTQDGATAAQLRSADAALRSVERMTQYGKAVRFAGLAGAAAAVGLGFLVKSAIDSADRLNDLSRSTGVSVEQLGGIGFAASQAGSDLEGVAQAFGKLNLKIAQAASGEKEASEAFKVLGISIKDASGATRSADAIFKDLATAFSQFQDGPEKAALANAVFGKSYAAILPLLDDGGKKLQENIEFYKRFGGVSTDTAQRADEFNDTLGKLQLITSQFGKALAVELLGPLQAVVDELLRAGETTNIFTNMAKVVRAGFESVSIILANVSFVLQAIGREIGAIAAQFVSLATTGSLEGWNVISEAVKEDGERARKELDDLEKRILGIAAGPSLASAIGTANPDRLLERQGSAKVRAPGLPDSGAASKAATVAKKRLEGVLSELDNFIKREEKLYKSRETALDRLYKNDQLSISTYFDQKLSLIEQNTESTAAAYDKQIALLQDFAKKTKDEATKLEALKDIGTLRERRDESRASGVEEAKGIADDRQRALRDYSDKVAEVNNRILELANTEDAAAEAARNRFEQQNRQLRELAAANDDSKTLENLNRLSNREEALARINAKQQKGQTIIDNLTNSEARLRLEKELGLRGELASLQILGDLRGAAAPQLKEIVAEWQRIVDETGDPQLAANLEAFKLQVDGIVASTNVLGQQFQTVFEDSFVDAFSSFVDGTKSAKDAFKSFADDVLKQINRMLSQELASALFGGMGSGAGAGGAFVSLLSGLFSGGGQSLTGVFASGSDYIPRDGLAYLHRGERIVPAHLNSSGGGGSVSQTINFIMPSTVTRTTQNQIASRTLIAAQRAVTRGVAA